MCSSVPSYLAKNRTLRHSPRFLQFFSRFFVFWFVNNVAESTKQAQRQKIGAHQWSAEFRSVPFRSALPYLFRCSVPCSVILGKMFRSVFRVPQVEKTVPFPCSVFRDFQLFYGTEHIFTEQGIFNVLRCFFLLFPGIRNLFIYRNCRRSRFFCFD